MGYQLLPELREGDGVRLQLNGATNRVDDGGRMPPRPNAGRRAGAGGAPASPQSSSPGAPPPPPRQHHHRPRPRLQCHRRPHHHPRPAPHPRGRPQPPNAISSATARMGRRAPAGARCGLVTSHPPLGRCRLRLNAGGFCAFASAGLPDRVSRCIERAEGRQGSYARQPEEFRRGSEAGSVGTPS